MIRRINVPTEGKTLEQIARDLREAAKAMRESIQKSGAQIQSFTAPLVR
jgi:predicted RNase H-like HicB family nuclease